MQLSDIQSSFEALGIKVAVMTYEPPATTITFTTENSISYPILFDKDARHVLGLGILNQDYGPGSSAYGIPNPGILLVDAAGIIKQKFSRTRYQERPELDKILAFIKEALQEKAQR